MEPRDHPEPEPRPERSSPVGEDVLRNLEARLDRASDAAERLLAEATARAAAAAASARGPDPNAQGADSPRTSSPGPASSEPPPAGWQTPENGSAGTGRELELLLGLLTSMRDLVPPELQQRLAEALRELLLAVRALIDWYLDRVERRRAAPSEVQDIPIQ